MRDVKKYFLRLLKVEMEDLYEDIQTLVDECKHKCTGDRPTEHVPLANLTTFQKELIGVGKFNQLIDAMHTGAYHDLDSLVSDLRVKFEERIHKSDLPPALNELIARKIDKVLRLLDAARMAE
jgi:hypothetical protein